jgi:hypothetical protein
MKTVTIDVRPLTETLGEFTRTWKSDKSSAPTKRAISKWLVVTIRGKYLQLNAG